MPDCPPACQICHTVCPYALEPKTDPQLAGCDRCSSCVSSCPLKKLKRTVTLAVAALLMGVLTAPDLASAHHNKGLPHYGYLENYPQVTTEEYTRSNGTWEMGAVIFNFQGLNRRTSDTPNDVKIYFYLMNEAAEANYAGPLEITILDGETPVASYKRDKPDEETVYIGRETLPHSGTYTLRAKMLSGDTKPLTLDFYVDLASDDFNWPLAGGIGTGLILFIVLIRYGKKQRLKPES